MHAPHIVENQAHRQLARLFEGLNGKATELIQFQFFQANFLTVCKRWQRNGKLAQCMPQLAGSSENRIAIRTVTMSMPEMRLLLSFYLVFLLTVGVRRKTR